MQTQAHKAMAICIDPLRPVGSSLKKVCRLITDDDVVIVFSDNSKLAITRHGDKQSWRTDRLGVIDD